MSERRAKKICAEYHYLLFLLFFLSSLCIYVCGVSTREWAHISGQCPGIARNRWLQLPCKVRFLFSFKLTFELPQQMNERGEKRARKKFRFPPTMMKIILIEKKDEIKKKRGGKSSFNFARGQLCHLQSFMITLFCSLALALSLLWQQWTLAFSLLSLSLLFADVMMAISTLGKGISTLKKKESKNSSTLST